MNKIAKSLVSFFVLTAFMLFSACSGDSDCPLSTQSLAQFSFVSSASHSPVKWNIPITVSRTVNHNGEERTDTIINKENNLSSLSLPLSFATKTVYTIHYNEKIQDVIQVTHKNIPYVSDLECGTMLFHHIEDVTYTTNALDSIVLINPDVNNEQKQNFTIYYTIDE